VILFLLFTNDVTICMELDPGIHIDSTWFVLKTGCDSDRTGPKWAWVSRPRPAGPAHFRRWFGPPFLAPEGSSTLKPSRRRHSEGESHSHQEAIHKLEREEGDLRREINHLEGSTHKWRRKKTPSEGWPWSTMLCLAPWWGNLLIRPWVVIDLEM
jgi:hypothetical protein